MRRQPAATPHARIVDLRSPRWQNCRALKHHAARPARNRPGDDFGAHSVPQSQAPSSQAMLKNTPCSRQPVRYRSKMPASFMPSSSAWKRGTWLRRPAARRQVEQTIRSRRRLESRRRRPSRPASAASSAAAGRRSAVPPEQRQERVCPYAVSLAYLRPSRPRARTANGLICQPGRAVSAGSGAEDVAKAAAARSTSRVVHGASRRATLSCQWT